MKCSKCGFNVPRGSKFCTNCGAIIKKHIARKVVASLIVIVLASGIVGGAFAWRKGIFPISKENNNNDISTTNNTTYENDESIILSEGFTSRKILDKESALAAIGDVADILGINDVYSEFGECKENTVEGNTYYRFYQEYNGIPVYGRSIIVCADENGDGQLLCGNFEIIANGEYESNASIKDIIGKLVQYLDDNNVKFNPDFFESLTLDQLEKCIYITEHNTCTLAYMIPFDYFEIIVDAISADILCMNNLLNSEKGYLASDINRINEFNVEYTDDGYTLIDSSRNITVMTLNGTPLKEYGLDKGGRQIYLGDHLNDGSALLIVSEDNVFGNNTREMNLDYETGAKLLINGSKVYDYFHNNFGYENSEMLKF